MGLLGMMAAGGAMGLRDASNNSVQAMNMLELENHREMLRQRFFERQSQQNRADAMEAAKMRAANDERKFHLDRFVKQEDHQRKRDLELEKIKANQSRQMALEDRKDKRALLRMDVNSKADGAGSNGVPMSDGSVFTPNDADSKNAVNLVRTGFAKNIQDAYEIIYASKFAGQAAGSIQGITEGMVPAARNMSRELLRNGSAAQQEAMPIKTFNPKTGKFE